MVRSSQLLYRITNYRHSENLNISPTSSTYEPASQINQRLSEIADPHGLTIVQPLSDLSSRLANFEGDSGIKVEFYQWNGNGKKTATSQVDQTIGVFVPPDAPALIGPVTFSIDAYHGTPHTIDPAEGFRLDCIGTGEGAQAYGYRFYAAGDINVGETYRKASKRLNIIKNSGGKQPPFPRPPARPNGCLRSLPPKANSYQ